MSKRSKQLKTTKTIKLQWIASIWRHNDKNVELRRNAFKTTQNYKSNQITMTCIYLMSKHWKQPKTKIVIILRWICIYLTSNRSKMLSYVSMHSKQHKTTKVIKLQWLASIWCQNILNYKSDQNTMTCIDFMSKRSKQLKTTKTIKLQWIASIWRHNDKNVELRRNAFKTTQNYKSNQITMTCNLMSKLKTTQNYKSDQITMNLHRFDVKRSKMLSYVAMHSKQHKTTKVIKLQWIDLMFNRMSKRSKQLKTTKTIKLQWIASIWRHNDKNVELRRNAFKTTQNYKSNQITMTCIDLMSKH